ncbi:TIGR04086 family membrane protein [Texcoconibacillus texcoconensis]|uniref:Putative membrane protein (TIGR04086 family) n=1 Tax=Texcoconibacillus texcoconensis TaxID=1095777 RepID=A0A840QPE0_9BACI|nr:TIGR04086 family membrane protein [Texcoconibacillus texcoconensis]MBB5173208.1 putative membrane protein (TIGR04086 family) [Texcoconibacillus texcoconensis]
MVERSFGLAISRGLLVCFVFILLTSFIASLVLRFTSMTETSIGWVLTVFSFIALFAGGLIAGGLSGQKGWLAGGATALLFTFIIYLMTTLGYDQNFTVQEWLRHGGYLASSVVGGVLGVNIFNSQS